MRVDELEQRLAKRDGASLLPGLAVVIAGAGAAQLVSADVAPALGIPVSALVVAVVVGAVFGNSRLAGPTTTPGISFATKRLLRVGVVLLGFRLSVTQIVDLGPRTVLLVVATVAVTFFGTQLLGRRLGVGRDLSLLVATGFSICGASAIAAVEGSTDADEEDVAMAVGLVTLFGTLAIVVLPVLADLSGLSPVGFGTWVGASVHDVAQVVATASVGGADVLAVAVVVKLTRVVLLAPIVAGVSRTRTGTTGERRSPVPAFVAGFLVAVAVRSAGVVPATAIDLIRSIEGLTFTVALVGLGAGVRMDRLRALGPRPVVLGLASWFLVAAWSYGAIVFLIPGA